MPKSNKQNLQMNSYTRYFFFTIIIALNTSNTSGQTFRQGLNVQIPDTLDFLSIDGNATAYYELYLTNCSTDTFKLKRLSISGINDSSILFTSQKQDLQNRYTKIGSAKKDTAMWLSPGDTAVIYVELYLPKKQIPAIAHLLTFGIPGKENLGDFSIQTSTTKCSSNTQLVLGAPLKGSIWANVYHPSWERGHRRVIYTLNEKNRIPGRYAIDLIKINSGGKYATGDENLIRNWLGYGMDVLAVADGVVSSVRNDFSESLTISGHPDYTADKATGNYISLKIGADRFAFYEHLQPKSIRVKIGQKVKKGEVIASVGFTGQTTGPHLHFHVADNDSPLGAEGIPFVFEAFEVLGSYNDFGSFGKLPWIPLSDAKEIIRKQERPSPNSVIRFRSK